MRDDNQGSERPSGRRGAPEGSPARHGDRSPAGKPGATTSKKNIKIDGRNKKLSSVRQARPPQGAHPQRARAVQVPDDAVEPQQSAREIKLYGLNACRAFVAHRRDRIIRAYFSEAVARRHFASLMKWLAASKLAYHLVTDLELERISGSGHHEGVCLLVRAEPPRNALDWLSASGAAQTQCVLALENVGNPHNLGAILRVAAHFGVQAVLVPDAKSLAGGAAVRTAEGGAEFVEVLDAADFSGAVRAFRKGGWRIVTTSSHKGQDIYRSQLPARSLILFGEESAGLSPDMLAGGDVCVRIPGSGKVESLNVSVATGILVGEWWRQQQKP